MVEDFRGWASDLALGALAVVVIAFAGWVLLRDVTPPSIAAGRIDPPPTQAPPDAGETETEAETESPSPSPEVEPLSVLVLGDESVRGARSAGRWVTELNDGEVAIDNRSRPLAGYLVAGPPGECGLPACPSLTSQLTMATREAVMADVVIISGGVHDLGPNRTGVDRGAIDAFFQSVVEAFPDAQVVVLSPVVVDGEIPPGTDGLAQTISLTSRAAGATYLDVGQPYLDARGDVSAAGAAMLAAVEAALPEAG